MVIAGVSGGDWGIRGFVSAYKAGTGERVWRHWTVPAKASPALKPGRERPSTRAAALPGLPALTIREPTPLFWATGNPWPNSDDRERGGDNLFTDCVLALDPATGK